MDRERLARMRRAMGITQAPRARVIVGPDLIAALKAAIESGNGGKIQTALDAFDDGNAVPPELRAAAMANLPQPSMTSQLQTAMADARGALPQWSFLTGKRPADGRAPAERAQDRRAMRERMNLPSTPEIGNRDEKGRRCWPVMGPTEFRRALLRSNVNTLTEGQRRARTALLAA